MVCFLSAQLLTTDLRAESAHQENKNHHLAILLSSFKHEGGNNEGVGGWGRFTTVIHRSLHNLFSFMYSTFRIKPYLVQIHENVVLILLKPSSQKHCHTYNSTAHGSSVLYTHSGDSLRCHVFSSHSAFTLLKIIFLSRPSYHTSNSMDN